MNTLPDYTETGLTLDSVNLIPTDELIEELLNRFPTVVVGFIDEEDAVHIHWDGSYPAALGFSRLLSRTLLEDDDDYED